MPRTRQTPSIPSSLGAGHFTEEFELVDLTDRHSVPVDLERGPVDGYEQQSAMTATAAPLDPSAELGRYLGNRFGRSTDGCTYIVYRLGAACSAALLASTRLTRNATAASRAWLDRHGYLQTEPTGNTCCDTVCCCDDALLLACSCHCLLACAMTGVAGMVMQFGGRRSDVTPHVDPDQGGSGIAGGFSSGGRWGESDVQVGDDLPKLPPADDADYMVVEESEEGKKPVLLLRRRQRLSDGYVPQDAMTAE